MSMCGLSLCSSKRMWLPKLAAPKLPFERWQGHEADDFNSGCRIQHAKWDLIWAAARDLPRNTSSHADGGQCRSAGRPGPQQPRMDRILPTLPAWPACTEV